MKFRKGHEWPVVFATLILIVPITLYRAWLLTFMWAWFVLPLGVATPSIWVLAGLLVMVSYVRGTRGDNDPKEYEWYEAVNEVIASGVTGSSFAFAFAWLIALLGGLI